MTRFSVCIPNFNYANYVGTTVRSVLDQREPDLEIVVADNASTDESLAEIAKHQDARLTVRRNATNVGFARNLDRAAQPAHGRLMIMLSSDDVMHPEALEVYGCLLNAVGDESAVIITSSCDVIDSAGETIGRLGPDKSIWTARDRAPELDRVAGGPVYQIAGSELLARSLRTMRNPVNFLATCYPRELYDAVGGYGGARLINPDKWFHWRLLGVASAIYFVDRPLFSYRWHQANQTAIQQRDGALKYLADEYANTLEIDGSMLSRAGLTREELVAAFVRNDIINHGFATLARGDRQRARRTLAFGTACYPRAVRRDRRSLGLRGLLALGPIGARVAAAVYARRAPERAITAELA